MRHAILAITIVLSAAALTAQDFASDERTEQEQVFGVSASGFSSLLGSHLHGLSVNDSILWKGWNSGDDVACSTTSTATAASGAFLDIPAGARLEFLRWWAKDTSADEDLVVELRQRCQEPAEDTPSDSGITFGGTTDASGYQHGSLSLASSSVDADTRNCVYYIVVRFCTTAACDCVGNAVAFMKARLQWRRQVSPAPQSSSYSDVPTNHAYFQHIEALKASGITGGCGAGKFCPDAPVTRAQLAYFMSKALGLHWPFHPPIILP